MALLFLTLGLPAHAEHADRVREHFDAKVSEALFAIQQDIVDADAPGGYYDKTYQHAEPFYWWNLPGWMEEDAAHHKASRILDIGCGYGTLLTVATIIYDGHGSCMDVTEYLLPAIQTKRNLQFTKGNVELDAIPSGPFDVILMTEVLEHFNFQPVPTLIRIRKALAPGGLFFLSTPDAKQWGRTTKYYKRLKDIPMPRPDTKIIDDHIWQYSEKELRQVLMQAGFSVLKWDYAPGIGHRHFNVMLRAIP